MLTSLSLKRFRSIRQAQVRLAPLTLIVGPNGSGKSSILRALHVNSIVARHLLRPSDEGIYDDDFHPRPGERSGSLRAELFKGEDVYRRNTGSSLEICVETKTGVTTAGKLCVRYPVGIEGKTDATTYEVKSKGVNAKRVAEAISRVVCVPVDRVTWWWGSPQGGTLAETGAQSALNVPLGSQSKLATLLPQFLALARGEESNDQGNFIDELDKSLQRVRANKSLSGELNRVGRELFGVAWSGLSHPMAPLVDKGLGASGVKLPMYMASLGTRQFFPSSSTFLRSIVETRCSPRSPRPACIRKLRSKSASALPSTPAVASKSSSAPTATI